LCCIVGPFQQSKVLFKKLLQVFQGADVKDSIQVNQIQRKLTALAQPNANKKRRKDARGSSKRDVPAQVAGDTAVENVRAKRQRKQPPRFDPGLDGQNDKERLKSYKPNI
jgi:hypothetical protein